MLVKYMYLLSLTTVKFSLNLLLKTTTKTKTMIINLPTDNFYRLLYICTENYCGVDLCISLSHHTIFT